MHKSQPQPKEQNKTMYTRLIQTKAQWFYSRHFVEFCKMFSNELQIDSDTTVLIVELIILQEYHRYFVLLLQQ